MGNTRGSIILTFIVVVILVAGLAAGYFLVKNEELKLVLLLMVAVIGFIGLLLIIFQLLGSGHKLQKRLKNIEKLVSVEPLETLKDKYVEIYNLYLKLKEKDKQHFYDQVLQLRERLEGQLKAEKKLQQLLEKTGEKKGEEEQSLAGQGTVEEQKKWYDEMRSLYEQLPLKVQEKYAGQLVQWKEELEKE